MLRFAVVLALTACSSEAAAPVAPPAEPPVDQPAAAPPKHYLRILVNTDTTLYDLEPDTLALTEVGRFKFPPGVDPKMTDIALDRSGHLWGVSFEYFFEIDPRSLAVKVLGPTPKGAMINSLAIISSSATHDREKPDLLVAAGYWTSTVYSVDTTRGTLTPIGDLDGYMAAGDITWGPGVGPVITVRQAIGSDLLAKLEPGTLHAKPIGEIGFSSVLGLARLDRTLLGVTEFGDVLEIDPATGIGTKRAHHDLVFYGAAVGWADVTARAP
jgi:hypothetical protein